MTDPGGDEWGALARLRDAIDAGDRDGARAGLVTLLLALGRVRAAEVVARWAATGPATESGPRSNDS